MNVLEKLLEECPYEFGLSSTFANVIERSKIIVVNFHCSILILFKVN